MSHDTKQTSSEMAFDHQAQEKGYTLTPFDGALISVRMPPLVTTVNESIANPIPKLAFSVLAPFEHGASLTVPWQEAGLPPLSPPERQPLEQDESFEALLLGW